MRRLLRFWFTFEEPVGRSAYLVHGLGLAVLKYGVDLTVMAVSVGGFWLPLRYLASSPFFLLTSTSGFFPPFLALWTLPFLWIGVCMTIRRLLDVGWSAWLSLLFFVPFANYVLILLLALLPGAASPAPVSAPRDRAAERLPSALLSIALGAGVGVAITAAAVLWLDSYGVALFLGTPFAIGLVTSFALCRRYPASMGETMEAVVMAVLLAGGASFVVGIEGAVCLLMAAPLGLAIGIMGAVAGHFLAWVGERPGPGALLVVVLLPGGAAFEAGERHVPVREVATAIVVDAPPDVVWDAVVAFPPLPEETSLPFRLGLAYPVRAEIDGEGVGAVRYCVFSTGAFVEPITAWEPGVRLAFDVAESPRPLEELSPWNVTPPHLDGYLVPRSGEFRLVALPGGRTRLEGSTWYEQRLGPMGYWVIFSDRIIGSIHRRVLEHVRDVAEARARGGEEGGPAG